MPLIAIPFFDGDKHDAALCSCTQDEYEEYTMSGKRPLRTIEADFFRAYVAKQEKEVPDLARYIVQAQKKYEYDWNSPEIISVKHAEELLNALGLNFTEFFRDYCEDTILYVKNTEF